VARNGFPKEVTGALRLHLSWNSKDSHLTSSALTKVIAVNTWGEAWKMDCGIRVWVFVVSLCAHLRGGVDWAMAKMWTLS
jgi:hypothetical protein